MQLLLKSLFIILTVISCQNFVQESNLNAKAIYTEKVDTLKLEAKPITTKPEIFETAFYSGTSSTIDTIPISFYTINAGRIKISSGKIIACDPVIMQDAIPYTESFPLGQYPVQLAIAKIMGDERVAFSRIYFSDRPVARWELALKPNQKPLPVGDTSMYGYSVDAGLGLFIDEEANKAFVKLRNNDERVWEKAFITETVKARKGSWEYVIYNFGKHNLAAFTTGFGDGFYGTYIGFDDNGKPCRLLTDFGLVAWWKK